MSGSRTACISCKAAKEKVRSATSLRAHPPRINRELPQCDLTRPKCGRCVQKGLVCSGLALDSIFTFRDQNEVAQRNSQRARREQQHAITNLPIQPRSSPRFLPDATFISAARTLPRRDNLLSVTAANVTDDDTSEQQGYWWLSGRAVGAIPEPLKRDVDTRAVERFFVNWILYPSNHGTSPGVPLCVCPACQ
jgi:hypothetical protein